MLTKKEIRNNENRLTNSIVRTCGVIKGGTYVVPLATVKEACPITGDGRESVSDYSEYKDRFFKTTQRHLEIVSKNTPIKIPNTDRILKEFYGRGKGSEAVVAKISKDSPEIVNVISLSKSSSKNKDILAVCGVVLCCSVLAVGVSKLIKKFRKGGNQKDSSNQ